MSSAARLALLAGLIIACQPTPPSDAEPTTQAPPPTRHRELPKLTPGALEGALTGALFAPTSSTRATPQRIPWIVQTPEPLFLPDLGLQLTLPPGWQIRRDDLGWRAHPPPPSKARLTLTSRPQTGASEALQASEDLIALWRSRGFQLRSQDALPQGLELSLFRAQPMLSTQVLYLAHGDRMVLITLEGPTLTLAEFEAWRTLLETLQVSPPTEAFAEGLWTHLDTGVVVQPPPGWIREPLPALSFAGPHFPGSVLRWRVGVVHHASGALEQVAQRASQEALSHGVPGRLVDLDSGRWGWMPAFRLAVDFPAPPVLSEIKAYRDLERLKVVPQPVRLEALMAELEDGSVLELHGVFSAEEASSTWKGWQDLNPPGVLLRGRPGALPP